MFKDTIPGLDRIFETDVKPPKIILVTGPPGSMKTIFVHALLSRYISKTDEYSYYTTLEENAASLLEGMESANVELTRNIFISDLTDFRKRDQATGDRSINYLGFIEEMITYYKNKHKEKFTCFALDSLGALYALTPNKDNVRLTIYDFFQALRQNNLFSFIIMERAQGAESQLLGSEGFLADGIINLGMEEKDGKITRYIQIEKMRSTRHSMEKFRIAISPEGFVVLRPLFG